MKTFGLLFCSKNLYLNLFLLFALASIMEPPNLDCFYFGLENLFLMLMVYPMGLVERFISYVNSKAVKYFRLAIMINTSVRFIFTRKVFLLKFDYRFLFVFRRRGINFQPRLESILWVYVVYVMVDCSKFIPNDKFSMDIQVSPEL